MIYIGSKFRVFKQMFAVCHGEASSGATHVPTALQGNIIELGVAKNSTCAIVEPYSDVVCWGTGLQSPYVSCTAGSKPIEINLWESTVSNTINGAILCSNQDLIQWNSANDIIPLVSSVTQTSCAPTNFCYSRNYSGSCTDFDIPLSYNGFVSQTYAGDASACVYLTIGNPDIDCLGSLSNLNTITKPPGATSIRDTRLSGNIACIEYNTGWQCITSASDASAENLVQLWPFVTSAKSLYPVGLGPLDLWYDFTNSKGILCAIREQSKETWCQGTGFTDAGDMNDAVFQMNAENTYDAAKVFVASTHICTLINQQSYSWVWIIVLLFIAILLIIIYLSYKHNAHKPNVDSYRIL